MLPLITMRKSLFLTSSESDRFLSLFNLIFPDHMIKQKIESKTQETYAEDQRFWYCFMKFFFFCQGVSKYTFKRNKPCQELPEREAFATNSLL